MESSSRFWRHRTGEFQLGDRTLLMGIINVTPDSFSDGGRSFSLDDALRSAEQMLNAGADLLDIGAESTRPGSLPVSPDEQQSRLLPVLEKLGTSFPIPISIDTRSSIVAKAALEHGASIINDVSGLRDDPALASVCASHKAGVVVMHMRGKPRTMQANTEYDDVCREAASELRAAVERTVNAGVDPSRVVVDPGIGFGKSFEQNYHLLANLEQFQGMAAGVLVGTSRKGFTGEFSKLPPDQRQFSSAAAVAISVLHGADVVRVHDVREMKQVVDICDRFRELRNSAPRH